MVNVIDGRNSVARDFAGSLFGFEFGQSSSDGFALISDLDAFSVNEAETDATKVTLERVTGIGTQKLVVYGSFPAYPSVVADRAAWRDTVEASLITTARFEKGPGDILDFTFGSPRRVDAFEDTVNDFLPEPDKIIGTNHRDFMGGKAGRDLLLGRGGNDGMDGGAGSDVLKGGGGHDIMTAGKGNDKLVGGGGNDQLNSTDGNDILFGGAGEDYLVVTFSDTRDTRTIRAGKDDDIIQFGLSKLFGAAARAGAENDGGSLFNFTADGGEGNDSAYFGDEITGGFMVSFNSTALQTNGSDANLRFTDAAPGTNPVAAIRLKNTEKFEFNCSGDGTALSFRDQSGPGVICSYDSGGAFGGFLSCDTGQNFKVEAYGCDQVTGTFELECSGSGDRVSLSGMPAMPGNVVVRGLGGNDFLAGGPE